MIPVLFGLILLAAAILTMPFPVLAELHDTVPALQCAKHSDQDCSPSAINDNKNAGDPIPALIADLHRDPDPGGTNARGKLISWGDKAVPYLLAALTCEPKCPNQAFIHAIAFVLGAINSEAISAVKPLVDKALDTSTRIALRLAALEALQEIGPYAKAHREPLRKLMKSRNRKLVEAASDALASIGDEAAVPYLLAKLKKRGSFDNHFPLARIAAMGGEGKTAGPKVEALLRDERDIVSSTIAAETLGWIGYRVSIPALIAAANSQEWALAYHAVWSLGHLRATEARETLTRLRAEHWSYPVKMLAAHVLEELDQPLPQFDAVELSEVIDHYRDEPRWLINAAPTCDDGVIWHGETLALESQDTWPSPPPSKPNPKFIPNYAQIVFALDKGWLVGMNAGEFCGDVPKGYLACGLHYFNPAGKHFFIDGGHVRGIYQTSAGLLVTYGMDHLSFLSGHVFRLSQAKSGAWSLRHLATLMAAPRKTAVASDGTLIIQTHGSVVAVSGGGKLEGVDCLQKGRFSTRPQAGR